MVRISSKRVIKVGNGMGMIIPKDVAWRNNIEEGDKIDFEITDIFRGERESYQSKRKSERERNKGRRITLR